MDILYFYYITEKLFFVPAFAFLLILAPSVSSADTLAKAKRLTHFYSVAPLLEKRFACFPSSGDGLRFAFFPFDTTVKNSLETQFTPAVILERWIESE